MRFRKYRAIAKRPFVGVEKGQDLVRGSHSKMSVVNFKTYTVTSAVKS